MSDKIINLFDLEKLLEKNLPKSIVEYYQSAARDEVTLKKNRDIYNKYELLPKLLRNVTKINTSIEILGLKLLNPIILGPVAMQQMAHQDGELASAAAAEKYGSAMTLSTSSNYSIDQVSKYNQNLFFQLYFAKDRSITEAMLKKTKEFGFKAIVFTADAPKLGPREKDERNKFKMPDHLSLGNFKGTIFEKFNDHEGSSMNMHNELLFDKTLTFETIHWIKETSGLPVLVKGILRPDDAAKCLEHKADGIIISNHGGRQLDTAVSTLKQVEPIRKEIGKSALLIMDGGIRRGTDVLKSLALGANAIQIGRPILWGLNHNGQQGVELVLQLLLDEFIESMILTGSRNISEITRDLVQEC
jgi:isopentenyl diphosphate isomerase/L-lactate dehydrogenase-like FMN-dependent dehydrogenase